MAPLESHPSYSLLFIHKTPTHPPPPLAGPAAQHVFNDSYDLPASSGIARILHLNPDRHVSYIVQSGQVSASRTQTGQRLMMARIPGQRQTSLPVQVLDQEGPGDHQT